MRIILFLFFLPIVSLGQHKVITFNTKGFPISIKKDLATEKIVTLLGLSNDFSFKEINNKGHLDNQDVSHVSLQQFYKNVPIENCIIKLHYNNENLYYINGEFVSDTPSVDFKRKISEKEALEIAKNSIFSNQYIWDNEQLLAQLPQNNSTRLLFPNVHGEMVIYNPSPLNSSKIFLTYKFDIYSVKPLSRQYVYVDAISGKVLDKVNRMHHVIGTADTRYSGSQNISTESYSSQYRLRDNTRGDGIETYNMQMGTNTTSAIDFVDNDNSWSAPEYDNAAKDNAALDVHWGSAMTYDYWANNFSWNSFDGEGGKILNYVHFDLQSAGEPSNDNAYWNGSIMIYGDGSYLFDAVTSLDIVAHELGHGLSDNTAQLSRHNESGAIDESLSDIWAACVEEYSNTGKNIWLLADEIIQIGPYPSYRNMSSPNYAFSVQPDTYEGTYWCDYTGSDLCATGDNGGIHTNSGVMNYWFYLLTEGGSGTNDNNDLYGVLGIGIDKAASIVFKAETEYMTANTTFANARTYTIQAAQELFGFCSPEVISTIDAWHAVGVGKSYTEISYKPITIDVVAPSIEDQYATYLLEASNNIESGTTVAYRSSETIKLLPGFKAESGASFLAQIIPCDDLSNAKSENTASKILDATYKATNGTTIEISLYPNPSDESINVYIDNNLFTPTSAKVFDIIGNEVKSFAITSKITTLNINELSAGTYFIAFFINNTKITKKIIIK